MAVALPQNVINRFVRAAFNGNIVAVEAYLARPDTNVDARDGCGVTALLTASMGCGSDKINAMIARLLDAGASVHITDTFGDTPLHNVSIFGDDASIRRLLDADAEIEARNKNGQTPLICAAGGGHTKAIAILIGAGANVHACDTNGRTVLQESVRFLRHANVEIVRMLLHAGVDVHTANNNGHTVFKYLRPWRWMIKEQQQQQQQITTVIKDWVSNTDKMMAFVDGLAHPHPDHESTALTRFAQHSTFDLNVVGLIFECLDGKPHHVDFAARSLKHQATGRTVSNRPLKRAKW